MKRIVSHLEWCERYHREGYSAIDQTRKRHQRNAGLCNISPSMLGEEKGGRQGKQMLMRGKDGYKCVSSLAGFFKRPAPINLDPCQPPLSSGIYSKEAAFHDLLIPKPSEGLGPNCKL